MTGDAVFLIEGAGLLEFFGWWFGWTLRDWFMIAKSNLCYLLKE
ncbi:hypothetical protein ACS8FB_03820 [Psychrobacter sp. 1U1]